MLYFGKDLLSMAL